MTDAKIDLDEFEHSARDALSVKSETTVIGSRDLLALIAVIRELNREIEELRCLDMCSFVDGELEQARADKFRAHLARCELCQRGVVANAELAARFSEAKRK